MLASSFPKEASGWNSTKKRNETKKEGSTDPFLIVTPPWAVSFGPCPTHFDVSLAEGREIDFGHRREALNDFILDHPIMLQPYIQRIVSKAYKV